VQAQILNLLMELQRRLALTCLFIAHDLRLVEHVCRRVAIMYRGRIVETGATARVFASPAHAYTRALLSAVPACTPGVRRERIAYDPATFDRTLDLREVGEDHYAAI
jgi:ABC-type oligopeptide transport system ATPase subunit